MSDRAKPTWTVFEVVETRADDGVDSPYETTLKRIGEYQAHDHDAACWMAAEEELHDRALSDNPPTLAAIRTNRIKPKPYRLEPSVKRVKP